MKIGKVKDPIPKNEVIIDSSWWQECGCMSVYMCVYMCVYVCDSAWLSHSSLLLISSLCSPTPCLLHPPANSLLPSLFLATTGRSVRKKNTDYIYIDRNQSN